MPSTRGMDDKFQPVNPSEIKYDNLVKNKSQSRLRIVAKKNDQLMALVGHTDLPGSITPATLHVFQRIAGSREHGITQAQLAKDMDVDPRSMFHNIKSLVNAGYVVKIPVTAGGLYTLLCLSIKFAHLNEGYKAHVSGEVAKTLETRYVKNQKQSTLEGSDHEQSEEQEVVEQRFEGLLKHESNRPSYYSGLVRQKLVETLSKSKTQIMRVHDLAVSVVCWLRNMLFI